VEVMKVYKNRNNSKIKTGDYVIKETTKFFYLGSTVNCDGDGCYDDIKTWINKAKAAFNNLPSIRNSKQLELKTMIRMFNSRIKSLIL
jgi:hypothetical protein